MVVSATEVANMNERVKIARKAIGLNQSEFADRLGVTATTISRIEKNKRGLTRHMINTICSEYRINETWLRSGAGEMIIESYDVILDALKEEFVLDNIEMKIVETYIKLPIKTRKAVKALFIEVAQAMENGEVKSMEEYIETHPFGASSSTMQVSEPRTNYEIINISMEISEDEAIAQVHARYAAAKKNESQSLK